MFTIVEDHADFIAIDKHPGVSFHRGSDPIGLLDFLRSTTGTTDLFPVHRLDKMTSGLLLFAKNKKTARTLADLFSKKKIEKYYLGIATLKPAKKQGLIIGDLERSRRGAWKLCRSKNNPAITQFFSTTISPGIRLYILKPHTGKTHQLRVTMKSIGVPIIGDDLYCPSNKNDVPLDRGYLHSYCLRFPLQDEKIELLCPPTIGKHFLSKKFLSAFNKFQQPWELPWPQITSK